MRKIFLQKKGCGVFGRTITHIINKIKKMNKKRKIKALMMMENRSEAIAAGYSLSEARAAGYSLSEAIAAGYSLSEARAAGYSLSAAIAAGYSLSEAIAAGYSLSEAIAAGYSKEEIEEWDLVPVLEKPYTILHKEIQEKKRIYTQSTWGECEDFDPKLNLCKTTGCMAFHLIQMAGYFGWILKKKYGFPTAASIIHYKTHPDISAPNFNSTDQDSGLSYIEYMAEYEETGIKP